jgi:hypothetical protein
MATSHGVDDYLETIYFLAFPIGEYQPSPGTSQAIAARVGEPDESGWYSPIGLARK